MAILTRYIRRPRRAYKTSFGGFKRRKQYIRYRKQFNHIGR